MIRRLSFGFVVVLVTAFIVAACGRQVTPNPPGLGPGGAPPGYMALHFDVASPFNFSQYQYMLVLNTKGNGVTPSTDSVQTNWAGYSFMLLVTRGPSGGVYAQPIQFVEAKNPHQPPAWLPLHTNPNQFQFNANSNGTGTEFSILADEAIFKGVTSPPPSPTPTPNNWTFNAFTAQASNGGTWTFYDSMGAGGPVDPQYNSPTICMSEPFDSTFYALDQQNFQDPSAQILSVEISSNPITPTPCP